MTDEGRALLNSCLDQLKPKGSFRSSQDLLSWASKQSAEDLEMINAIVKREVEYAMKNTPMFNWRSRVMPTVKMSSLLGLLVVLPGKMIVLTYQTFWFLFDFAFNGITVVSAYLKWCEGVRISYTPEYDPSTSYYWKEITIYKLTQWFPDNEEGK